MGWVYENITRPKLNGELNLRISSNILFKDFVENYYWVYAYEMNNGSTNQSNKYRMNNLKEFFGKLQLKDINLNHIKKYFMKRSAQKSKNNPIIIISKCSLNRERAL